MMSSTIVHAGPPARASADSQGDLRHPFLVRLGERVRALRARRGMTRKALAGVSGVSERYLANLEVGLGNASVLVLLEVARGLDATPAELLGERATSPEWLMIREMLEHRDETTLRRVREGLARLVDGAAVLDRPTRSRRIALIGLRGAGKSTLGRMLAEEFGFPLVELSRQIERSAGCTVPEIQALYGQNAYRRYERRALEEVIRLHPEAVIAAPGGLVSDPATLHLLLEHCTSIWLQAKPEDHMRRVAAQGDMRPMQGHAEAMEDLKAILAGRAALYSKAEFSLDTSAQPLAETYEQLSVLVRRAISPA